MASIGKALDHGPAFRSDTDLLVLNCVGVGVGISLLIALFCDLVFSHRIG